MLVIVSVFGGCVGGENELPLQGVGGNNPDLVQESSLNASEAEPNTIHVLMHTHEFNKTGKIYITLKVLNPRMNENVLTVFKPDFGASWYNQSNITQINNNVWTQNFSIKPVKKNRYVMMLIQISENESVVKRAAWNVSLREPVGS